MKHKKRGPAHPLLPNEAEYCRVGGKVKRKYPSQLDAELSTPSKDLHQYVCEFCGFWHNGSSNHDDLEQQTDQSNDRHGRPNHI